MISDDDPALTWTTPAGSALAALLGLAGTGLVTEYRSEGGAITWRPYLALAPGLKVMRWLIGSTAATFDGSRSNTGHPGTRVPSAWKA